MTIFFYNLFIFAQLFIGSYDAACFGYQQRQQEPYEVMCCADCEACNKV